MDRNPTIEIIVGAFVLVGIILFIILSIRVSGIGISEGVQGRTYQVYASFDNIGGLRRGSRVTMSGVLVGSVSNIMLDRNSQRARVEMKIDRSIDFLTADTSAAIQTSGLLGEQYIELTSGADEELLEDGDEVFLTQSAFILENLIGRFLFQQGQN